jgi:hypothetical protein
VHDWVNRRIIRKIFTAFLISKQGRLLNQRIQFGWIKVMRVEFKGIKTMKVDLAILLVVMILMLQQQHYV